MASINYSHYIYQVKKNQKILATFCLEQDAIDFVAKNGGEIYTIGAY